MSPANVRALATKELHHLWPLVFALLALEILGLVRWFVAQSPDGITWEEVSILLDPNLAQVAGMVYLVVGIVTAYLLFPHESDQNTLQFLWSLPVARWQIYITKLGCAFVVLASLLLVGHLLIWWIHLFGVGSISSSQFSWQLWSRELASMCGAAAIALGYGALIAQFRIVGILGFLICWAGAQALAVFDTSYEYLDVTALLVPEYRGTEVLLNAKAWIVQAASAIMVGIRPGLRTPAGQSPE